VKKRFEPYKKTQKSQKMHICTYGYQATIFHISMAHNSLFMLKVPLNTN